MNNFHSKLPKNLSSEPKIIGVIKAKKLIFKTINTLWQILISSIGNGLARAFFVEWKNIQLITKLQPEANVSWGPEHSVYRESYSVSDNKVTFANNPIGHETS